MITVKDFLNKASLLPFHIALHRIRNDRDLFKAVHGFLMHISCLLFIAGCGTSQPITPIEEGATEITASLGGPVIPLDGFAIPAPYLNLGAIYGMNEYLSLHGNVHVTAALFKDIGFDGGFVTSVLQGNGIIPAVTVNGRGNFFWDIGRSNNARFFPQVTLIGHYKTDERSLFYFGADNFFQIHKFDYLLSPLIGYQFPISVSMNSLVEVKWLAANKDTRHGVFEGATSVAGHGGAGIYFGIQYELK